MAFVIGERRLLKFERIGELSRAFAIEERRPLKLERFGEISIASTILTSMLPVSIVKKHCLNDSD